MRSLLPANRRRLPYAAGLALAACSAGGATAAEEAIRNAEFAPEERYQINALGDARREVSRAQQAVDAIVADLSEKYLEWLRLVDEANAKLEAAWQVRLEASRFRQAVSVHRREYERQLATLLSLKEIADRNPADDGRERWQLAARAKELDRLIEQTRAELAEIDSEDAQSMARAESLDARALELLAEADRAREAAKRTSFGNRKRRIREAVDRGEVPETRELREARERLDRAHRAVARAYRDIRSDVLRYTPPTLVNVRVESGGRRPTVYYDALWQPLTPPEAAPANLDERIEVLELLLEMQRDTVRMVASDALDARLQWQRARADYHDLSQAYADREFEGVYLGVLVDLTDIGDDLVRGDFLPELLMHAIGAIPALIDWYQGTVDDPDAMAEWHTGRAVRAAFEAQLSLSSADRVLPPGRGLIDTKDYVDALRRLLDGPLEELRAALTDDARQFYAWRWERVVQLNRAREATRTIEPFASMTAEQFREAHFRSRQAGKRLEAMYAPSDWDEQWDRVLDSRKLAVSLADTAVKNFSIAQIKGWLSERKIGAYAHMVWAELMTGAFRNAHLRELERLAQQREIEKEIEAQLASLYLGKGEGLAQVYRRDDIVRDSSPRLMLEFSKPVKNVVVRFGDKTLDSFRPDEARTDHVFLLYPRARMPALVPLEVSAVDGATGKALDGDPGTPAQFRFPEMQWYFYEPGPDFSHNLRFGDVGNAVSLLLLIDCSQSMDERIAAAREAAASLLRDERWIDPQTQIALWVFSDNRPRLVQGFTEDRELLAQAINRPEVGGGTPLGLSIERAGNFLLQYGRFEKKALLILTDGQENRGGNPAIALDELRERGVYIREIPF